MAYGNRGAAYGSLGQLQRAIEDLDKAIHFDPQLTNVYAERAVTHTLLGMHEKADQDVERAAELEYDCNLLIRAVEEALGRRGGFEESDYYLCDAPDFEVSLYDSDGILGTSDLRVSDLQGKPLVLNFWFGSCPPCRGQIHDQQEFYDENADRVNLLSLDLGVFIGQSSRQDALDFLAPLDITYLTGYPLDDNILSEIIAFPSTFFITADGRIFKKWSGPLNKDALERITEEMLTFSEPAR